MLPINFISANHIGVVITDPGTSGNLILGNVIGTNETAAFGFGNQLAGVKITNGADLNVIGTDPPFGNLICGNNDSGIIIDGAKNI